MMKLLFTAFCCTLITLTVNGQLQFGIFGGPQTSSAKYDANGIKQKTGYKYGFHAGVTMKVPFEGRLYFAPAAFYSMKGYKVNFTQFVYPPGPQALNNNTTIHTFELAPMLQVDLSSQPSHFFFKAGPTLDFQLFGKEKFDTLNGSVDRKMKWGYADYGRFSANALLQFGYESSNGFFIFGQYTHGLASINNADYGPSIRHRVFGISIGKFINRSKVVIDTRNKE
jgi:hypothetical protein